MLSKNEKYPELASKNECTGCLACVDVCPTDALKKYMAEDGHIYVALDYDKCVKCKKCEQICKSSREKYGDNKLYKSQVYAAWSLNEEERKKATSGGVFAALARNIIEKGGVVVGAHLEGRECKHIMIEKIEEIEKLQGSKYMASSMNGIYKIIKNELSHRLVLFSGVGCQCAGVLAFFENSPYRDNLITVDLVCGGAPSHLLLDKFYDHYPKIEKIISYRNKDKYELRVLENGKERILYEKNLPLHGFNCELTNRFSCYQCQFACAHRLTDITIGDLWNYNYLVDEHSKGISSIIIHTKRGMSVLMDADILLNELKWSQCINYCKRIVCGKSHIFIPRKNLVTNSKKMKYDEFTKLYCIAMKPLDLKMEVFRIYRFLVMRFDDYKIKKYIKKLLEEFE